MMVFMLDLAGLQQTHDYAYAAAYQQQVKDDTVADIAFTKQAAQAGADQAVAYATADAGLQTGTANAFENWVFKVASAQAGGWPSQAVRFETGAGVASLTMPPRAQL